MSGSSLLPYMDVSRETTATLDAFVALLIKWNPAINLVSRSTLSEVWLRHIVDSAQLATELPMAGHWLDLGSGGGLPGIVLAIIAQEKAPEVRFTLVESDQRKATFLRQSIIQLKLAAKVECSRIESLLPQDADVISARALAPLAQLCAFAHRHLKPDGIALFPKGEAAEAEITLAREAWAFDLQAVPSMTNTGSQILKLKNIRHV